MSTPRKKRPRMDSHEKESPAITTLMEQLNAAVPSHFKWFICVQCNKIKEGGGNHLATSKWGYERTFCDACVLYCRECDEQYSSAMSYRHEDCAEWEWSEEDKEWKRKGEDENSSS